jgi:hypothetical protein
MKVLLVDRFQQPHHCSLDDLVLERRLANRALPPVILLDPHPRYGYCLIASTAQTLMQVVQVLVEVLGIHLGRHSVDARGTRLARVAVCLPQKVLIDQVREGRKYPLGIADGLRRKALKFWWDGW